MADSHCGLHCIGCEFKDSHNCGGCIETMGHPFHGQCPVAICCRDKGFEHCGQCDIMPCEKLYDYSYLDDEHGDKPPGTRVETCRRWAAESGKGIWRNVLLLSSCWSGNGHERSNIKMRFINMLGKPANEAKVLFIPTAAIDVEAIAMVEICRNDLLDAGITDDNIRVYDIGGSLTPYEAMEYDVVYITGGNTGYLMNMIKKTGFDAVIRKMVYANKIYVGVSSGSIIESRDISAATLTDMARDLNGLALVNAYLSVHCPENTQPRTDLPLPHIPLTDNQALAVAFNGYELIYG